MRGIKNEKREVERLSSESRGVARESGMGRKGVARIRERDGKDISDQDVHQYSVNFLYHQSRLMVCG